VLRIGRRLGPCSKKHRMPAAVDARLCRRFRLKSLAQT